jgi:NDP-sugar pyrophosphorylase family protein
VLVGGQGTRLKRLFPDTPKALVPLAGRAVIDRLVDGLVEAGVSRIILATGHLHDRIAGHFQARHDADLTFSREERPLGTGGALKKALARAAGEDVLVLNGDSTCAISYQDLVHRHRKAGLSATLVAARNIDRDDGGNVTVDASGIVSSFQEKSVALRSASLNAGIYVFDKRAREFAEAPESCSLEHDLLPSIVRRRACAAFVTDAPVVDIGTPERYHAANKR